MGGIQFKNDVRTISCPGNLRAVRKNVVKIPDYVDPPIYIN